MIIPEITTCNIRVTINKLLSSFNYRTHIKHMEELDSTMGVNIYNPYNLFARKIQNHTYRHTPELMGRIHQVSYNN